MSRLLRVAAAQSGPIQKAESRQAVVKRLPTCSTRRTRRA